MYNITLGGRFSFADFEHSFDVKSDSLITTRDMSSRFKK